MDWFLKLSNDNAELRAENARLKAEMDRYRWALVSIRDMDPFRTAEELAGIADAVLRRSHD